MHVNVCKLLKVMNNKIYQLIGWFGEIKFMRPATQRLPTLLIKHVGTKCRISISQINKLNFV